MGFLLCLFLRRLRFSTACPAAGSLWRLPYLSGSRCLSCSCSGAMSVGFEVSFVRGLFSLVPCSSSSSCSLRSFPAAGYLKGFCPFWPHLPALLLRWWRVLRCHPALMFSGLLLHRLPCRSLDFAPCVRVLPLWLSLLLFRLCGGALWLPEPLGFVGCSVIISCGSQPLWGAVLCSLLVFTCLRVGVLLACGVCGAC